MDTFRDTGVLQVQIDDITDGDSPLLDRVLVPEGWIFLRAPPCRLGTIVSLEMLCRAPLDTVLLSCADQEV